MNTEFRHSFRCDSSNPYFWLKLRRLERYGRSAIMKKKVYVPPELTCFGKVGNFTTGGSSMMSEWSWSWRGFGKMKMKVWMMNMRRNRNSVKP